MGMGECEDRAKVRDSPGMLSGLRSYPNSLPTMWQQVAGTCPKVEEIDQPMQVALEMGVIDRIEALKTPRLIIREGLHELFPGVHHKGSGPGNGLVEPAPCNQQ